MTKLLSFLGKRMCAMILLQLAPTWAAKSSTCLTCTHRPEAKHQHNGVGTQVLPSNAYNYLCFSFGCKVDSGSCIYIYIYIVVMSSLPHSHAYKKGRCAVLLGYFRDDSIYTILYTCRYNYAEYTIIAWSSNVVVGYSKIRQLTHRQLLVVTAQSSLGMSSQLPFILIVILLSKVLSTVMYSRNRTTFIVGI